MVRSILNIEISENDIRKEFNQIINNEKKGYESGNYWNDCILYFQWQEFYKQELNMWEENKISTRYSLPLQSYLYMNRKKYINKTNLNLTNREILRAFKISGIHMGNSFHCPFWIKQFIRDYNIKSIYDPCGGWGHRLLGAHNIKYIYNDINPVTYQNVKNMSNYFKLVNKYFYNQDSANFIVKLFQISK